MIISERQSKEIATLRRLHFKEMDQTIQLEELFYYYYYRLC